MKLMMNKISGDGYVSSTAQARVNEFQIETMRREAGTTAFPSMGRPKGNMPAMSPLPPENFRVQPNDPPEPPEFEPPKKVYTSELAPAPPPPPMTPLPVVKSPDAPRMPLKLSKSPDIPTRQVNTAAYQPKSPIRWNM